MPYSWNFTGAHGFADGERHFPSEEHQEEELHGAAKLSMRSILPVGVNNAFRFLFGWQGASRS